MSESVADSSSSSATADVGPQLFKTSASLRANFFGIGRVATMDSVAKAVRQHIRHKRLWASEDDETHFFADLALAEIMDNSPLVAEGGAIPWDTLEPCLNRHLTQLNDEEVGRGRKKMDDAGSVLTLTKGERLSMGSDREQNTNDRHKTKSKAKAADLGPSTVALDDILATVNEHSPAHEKSMLLRSNKKKAGLPIANLTTSEEQQRPDEKLASSEEKLVVNKDSSPVTSSSSAPRPSAATSAPMQSLTSPPPTITAVSRPPQTPPSPAKVARTEPACPSRSDLMVRGQAAVAEEPARWWNGFCHIM